MSEPNKKRVLLAEDDASMRRFLTVILQKAGYEVLIAKDGLSALEISAETPIDALVADAIMPNLSGYDLCRLIRARFSDRRIPCIILSGLAENDDNEKLADVFLVKDVNLKDQLLDELNKLV